MSILVAKLKQDHNIIVAALAELKSMGATHPDFTKKLLKAKAALLSHLKLEDAELYPALQKAAETDLKVRATLEVLAIDLAGIAKAAMQFFDKYEKVAPPNEFLKDFSDLHSALALRIRREESTLYTLFDELESGRLNKDIS
jgi:hypothetical protein